jgi:ABC-type transport system involved in multi-copper enzyme maturation permease subunit
MSPLKEAQLACVREIRKNLRSWKGVAMGALFLLGGGAALLIYVALSNLIKRELAQGDIPEEVKREMREKTLALTYDQDIAHYLSAAPPVLLLVFKATLLFVPLLTLLIGFEQICGDLQHRTFRYAAIRARRSSLVAGKMLGVWAVVSTLTLLLHAVVWIVTIGRGEASLALTLSWGLRLWAFTVVYTGTYSGLTILASSVTRRPALSLFIGLFSFALLAIGDLASSVFDSLKSIRYAFPGFYELWMITPRAGEMAGAVAVLLAFAAASTAAAAYFVNRSDV